MKKLLLGLLITLAYSANSQTVEFNHINVNTLQLNQLQVTLPINKNISAGTGYNNEKNVPIFVRIQDNTAKTFKLASNFGYITNTGVFVNLQVGMAKNALFAFLGVQAQEVDKRMNYGLVLNVGVKI